MNAVEYYIEDLPKSARTLFKVTRSLILDSGPAITEKISYKIPFFYYFGPLVYLNQYKGGVDIGFFRGHALSNEQQLLEIRERKIVASIPILSLEVFNQHENQVREILQEALLLNEMLYKNKKLR